MPLTRRQSEILGFIAEFVHVNGYSPTLKEIGERFDLRSPATIHKHVAMLVDKGYLGRSKCNASRDLRVLDKDDKNRHMVRVPLLGYVAAGLPIEAITGYEEINLPEEWLGRGQTYALQVRGDSMIDEQIRDGDTVVVETREMARNGETVIALIDGDGATVKQYQRNGATICLHPANPAYPVMEYNEERVQIQGVVVGVLRRF